MKKWHYFLVALFAVFCSSAIVIGSSVNSYVGAKQFASAYTFYDVNADDDQVYWEQTDISVPEGWDSKMVVPFDSKAFCFTAVVDDSPLSSLDVIVFDNGTFSTSSVDVDSEFEIYQVSYDSDGLITVSYVYYNGNVYIFNNDSSKYFSFDGSILGASTLSYNYRALFNVDSYNSVFYVYGNDFNGTESELWSCDDAEEYFFLDGSYLYLYECYYDQDYPCFVRVSPDGTISSLEENVEGGTYMGRNYTWSDGKYAYYDNGSTHMIFDTQNNEWVSHTWSGYTGSFSRSNVWSDGNDIYMTLTNGQTYKLHVENAYVSPYPNVLSELIALITGGIAGFASGIGENLSVLAESIFVDATNGGLSAFGGLVVIFASVALALGLSRCAVNFITSLGKRNR